MRMLRVLLSAAPDAARAEAWALFDADGRLLDQGRDLPARWPASDGREAVLACDAVRVVALRLPPLPRDRLIAAATYALEDRLAAPADDAVVAVGERDPDGRMTAIIAARELIDALASAMPPFSRVVAEPELAPAPAGWRWCASERGGFVRTDEGGAFPVGAASEGRLPGELAHALAESARNGWGPSRVSVETGADPSVHERWTREMGVPFIAGTRWRWEAAPSNAFSSATDILAARPRPTVPGDARSGGRFAFALTVAALALGLHVAAAVGTWIWQRVALASARQGLVDVALQAGVRDAVAENAAAAVAARHVDARHRAGLAAPNDAMPLLARAAPALAALPAGTLRSATWAAGAWTLDLAAVDEPALAAFVQRVGSSGLQALHARTASGLRARISEAP